MKILRIIQSLDNKTLEKLHDFLRSPYFNKDLKIIELVTLLRKNVKLDTIESSNNLWVKLYPNSVFNDLKFRKLTHKTLKLIEDFCAVENTLSHEHKKIRAVAEFCENKDISEIKNKLTKRIKALVDKDLMMWSESFYDLFTAYRYTLDIGGDFAKKTNVQASDEFSTNMNLLSFMIDTLYALEKNRLSLVRNNYSHLLNSKSIAEERLDLSPLYKSDALLKSRLWGIQSKLYALLIEESENFNFDGILQYLKVIAKSNKKEAQNIYDNINNYITRKINSGRDLYQDSFNLMRIGLSEEIIIKDRIIDPTDYRNIVVAACRTKEYDWALNFIEEYKNSLLAKYRQSAYSFSKARVFNNMGNHEGVVEILRNVEYDDITYNLNSRLMLIMAFYELDEYDTLDSIIKAFKVFLRRKRNVSIKRKANFRDFCDVVYNLMRAADRKDASRIAKAEEIMQANKGIPSSWWLKEKIAEVSEVLGYKPEKATAEDPSV